MHLLPIEASDYLSNNPSSISSLQSLQAESMYIILQLIAILILDTNCIVYYLHYNALCDFNLTSTTIVVLSNSIWQ